MTAVPAKLPMLTQVRNAVRDVEAAHAALREARERLQILLTEAVSAFIYPGLLVDLRNYRQLPECFVNVRTTRGADRGTKVFRIESSPSVEVNTSHIDLSVWRCDATPISEKTGKDMSGASHGADSRQTVRLQAHLIHVHDFAFDEASEDFEARTHKQLLKFIAEAEAAASARYLANFPQFAEPVTAPSASSRSRKP
jgi:hypothetical protein